MGSGNELAEATLDTLPITVAVIDTDGEILLTNRSWREFGPDEVSSDDVGVDYLATAGMDDDEYARQAVDGLEAVTDGDRETFSMEYPCHTPERKQWFLMRANRFTVDGAVRVSILHLEITERKLAEITVEETATQLQEEHLALEHVLDRVDGLVRDVTDAAVGATSRQEIEREVCARLADTDPYVLAWIGRTDVTNRRLSPREWARDGDLALEDEDLAMEDESHPAVEALETGKPRVLQDVDEFDDADRWWPSSAGDGFRSVAALPISYGDVTYGVLVLFASEPDVFSERELLVLESLAGTVATAMNAVETQRMLATDAVVELEVAIGDSSPLPARLAAELGAAITYRGQTYDEEGWPLVVFHADRAIETLPASDEFEDVTDLEILSTYDDGALLEVAVRESVLTTLSEHGASVRRFDAASADGGSARRSGPDDTVDLTVALSTAQAARSAYDLLERRYEAVELISYHERNRPPRTPQDVMERLESSLTDRQQTALRKAYYADYFEWPRNISGEDLARSMDISRSTFHQHLRTAQRKLLEELFSGDPTSEG